MNYKLYNGKTIDNTFLNEMHNILVENYNKINNKDNSSTEMYNEWVNMIRTTKDYNILICLDNNLLVGFICYTYLDIGLMLSEIQIKKEYQGKHILKNMIKNVLMNTNNTYSKVYATINNDNTKSKEVFTHIGFKNIKGILYEIDKTNLMKWTN